MALGAAVACPDRPVIGIQADGSAMYTISALWTYAREQCDVTTIVCDNGSYAILEHELSRVGAQGDGKRAGQLLDLGGPDLDFVALATGMGVPATRATTAEELADQLRRRWPSPVRTSSSRCSAPLRRVHLRLTSEHVPGAVRPVPGSEPWRSDGRRALRELQAPLKQRYRDDPESGAHLAPVPTSPTTGSPAPCRPGPAGEGFRPVHRGDGADACSGDMLLQALLACAGVTMRSVATAMGVEIRGGAHGHGDMDARGRSASPGTRGRARRDQDRRRTRHRRGRRDARQTGGADERYCVVARPSPSRRTHDPAGGGQPAPAGGMAADGRGAYFLAVGQVVHLRSWCRPSPSSRAASP